VGSISESGVSRRIAAMCTGIVAFAAVALLWLAPAAQASEILYWDNYNGTPDSVSFANIDGTGGGSLNLGGLELKNPEGMAIDPLTNQLFVASTGSGAKGQIFAVNLDGSGAYVLPTPGAPVESPEGVAVNPATGILYWANDETTASIGWAKVDGSGGGLLNTAGAKLEGPYKVALDLASGRIFWANSTPAINTISFANLNNTGGGDLSLAGASAPEGISGLSVDPTTSRLYWLDTTTKKVSFASLSGSGGGGDVNLTGATISQPYGLALDPSIGRLYWGNYGLGTTRTNAIGFAATGGGGGGITPLTAPVNGPQDPVILKSPSGAGAPTVTRSASSRSTLSCSTGAWAPDFAGSFVYQSPRTLAYQWTRNGVPIAGATAVTFEAKSAGQYACIVTASNQAGSASQASAAVNVKAAKVKLTVKKKVAASPGGVAVFKVKATNQGDLKSKSARVCAKVPKKAKADLKAPKCKSLGKLKGRGKRAATLKVKVGGSADGTYKVTFSVRGASGKTARSTILVR
jgi:hypothetical protein